MQVDELGDVLDDVVRVPQRGQPLPGHARADDLVVVERHALRSERPGLRLADVVEQRGEAQRQRRGASSATTAIVCASTSLWWWIGSCSSCIALSSGRNSSESPVSREEPQPGDGSSTTSSFESSSRIRSALTISSRLADARRPRRPARASGSKPEPAMNRAGAQHAQRIVGERHVGRERRAQPVRRQVAAPSNGSTSCGLGQAQRHRVDGEVAPREIGLDVVGEDDLGLAALGVVHVRAVRRDLARDVVDPGADRAEPRRLRATTASAHRSQQRLDRVGPGVGREVDVGRSRASVRAARHARSRRRGSTRGPLGPRAARHLLDRRRGREQRLESRRERGHRPHCDAGRQPRRVRPGDRYGR